MIPIADSLLAWYADNGRHELPWRQTQDSYALWLAEIMLQQTQVESVKPYYARFLQALPSWEALARAPQDQVLALWSGLGYYARARNAQRAAQKVCADFAGQFPDTREAAETLPGVGRSTAAAVLASAYDQQEAILDANARRVLIRSQAIRSDPKSTRTLQQLWELAEALTPTAAHTYNQAIQDLGAMICTPRHPRCDACPLQRSCMAYAEGLSEHLPLSLRKRDTRERCVFFLQIEDGDGRVFLEKRPDSGIWGGLWCLPQFHPQGLSGQPVPCTAQQNTLADGVVLREQVRHFCAMQYGLVVEVQGLTAFYKHVFTHFQLYFRCIHIRLRDDQQGTKVADQACAGHWYAPEAALAKGLPTPIRKILSRSS